MGRPWEQVAQLRWLSRNTMCCGIWRVAASTLGIFLLGAEQEGVCPGLSRFVPAQGKYSATNAQRRSDDIACMNSPSGASDAKRELAISPLPSALRCAKNLSLERFDFLFAICH